MQQLHECLRRLRLDRGMTQAEVAEKLNVTRQTVSSYESGRTQPDVEMLKRLAEVYGVSVQEILSSEPPVKADDRGQLKLLWGMVALLLLCTVIRDALFLLVNYCYVVPEGPVAQEMLPVLQTRFSILDAAEWIERGLLLGGWWLGVILLVQRIKSLLPAKRHGAAMGLLGCFMLLLAVLGAAADPQYGFGNYWGIAGVVLVRAVVLLLIGLAAEWYFARKKR